jgi:hypothetical protein
MPYGSNHALGAYGVLTRARNRLPTQFHAPTQRSELSDRLRVATGTCRDESASYNTLELCACARAME